MNLHGATALVTGAGHRLGRHIALGLAEAGARVAINYFRSAAAAQETLDEVIARGSEGLMLQADVADAEEVERMLTTVIKHFERLDLLVANAGAFRRTPLASVAEKDWDDMMRLNFDTTLVPARRVGLSMKQQGSGCIIALADVAALRPWSEYIPYCVAKSCVIALTRTLAAELAPEVRVNCVAPGPILFPEDFTAEARRREVNRTLLRRQGDPQQISEAVLLLARDEYMTGTVIPVDAGRLLT